MDKKSKEKADIEFYRKKWNDVVECSKSGEDDKNYIDIVISYIDSAQSRSSKNKMKWKLFEYGSIIIMCCITCLSTISLINPNEFAIPCNVISAVLAAVAGIATGINNKAAYKETWLRHNKRCNDLKIECHNFSVDYAEYNEIKEKGSNDEEIAICKIEKFKKNTSRILQDDYDKFLSNINRI